MGRRPCAHLCIIEGHSICQCHVSALSPPEVHPAFGISWYVSECDAEHHGFSLSGNMLNFQAYVSGNGQRFSASQMRPWHWPCQRTPLGLVESLMLVHVGSQD